jgi:hypothetical protein
MKTTIKLLNDNILKEGKRYLWSGHTESLYSSLTWKNDLCKVTKIKDGVISIYDYSENSEYDYTLEQLNKIDATFRRLFFNG